MRTNKLDLCFSHKSKRGLKNSVRPVQTSNSVSKRYLIVECGEPTIVMSKIWEKKAGKSTLKLVEMVTFWSYIFLKLQSYNLTKSEFFFRGGGEVCAPQHTHVTRL